MKRHLARILIFTILITGLSYIGVICQEYNFGRGYVVEVNGDVTDYKSVVFNNIHYVPLRRFFEQMGSSVFYRGRDNLILALLCNGDEVRHYVGDNTVIVNGEEKAFANPSVTENGTTYMPIDMLSTIFWVDDVSYEDELMNIQKQNLVNEYHQVVKDILDVSKSSNFHPERYRRYINYHLNNPSYSVQDVIFKVNLGLDYPFYQNIKTIEYPHELLVLVNKYNKLPSNFSQYNLVNMQKKHTVNDGKKYLLEATTYENYIKMYEDAKKEGLSLRVVSAHRTEDYQAMLYNNKVNSSGKVYADNYSARPGHSEHQTGMAVDINSVEGVFEYTQEFKWLKKHAHEYGFILRYPKGKEWITGYSYEPWHYRYVGVDVAKVIYEEDITYEEYCAKYISSNEFRY